MMGAGMAVTRDWLHEVALGRIPGARIVQKFGLIADTDAADGDEVIQEGEGAYKGHTATGVETVEFLSSSAEDAGTVLSTGTLTGGSATTAADTGATFSTDGGLAGHIIINDTKKDHAIVTSLTETVLTHKGWRHNTTPAVGDTYRLVKVLATKTGAAVVRANQLLDANGAEQVEYIVMNGTTGVDSSGTYSRHHRAKVVLAGTALGSVGVLTSRQKTTTTNIFMAMIIGYNSTMITAYTIPAGEDGWILDWGTSLAGKTQADGICKLQSRPTGQVYEVKEQRAISASGSSNQDRTYRTLKDGLPPWTDLYVTVDADTNDTSIAGYLELLMITRPT